MPSLQSRALSWILRRVVKARSHSYREVEFVRAAVNLSLRLHLPYYDVTLRKVELPGVQGEWVIPPRAPRRPVLMYLHGGGYFFCSPRTHRPLTMSLARQAGMRILALRYRLAPEFPFPAALHDALAAFRWLRAGGLQPHEIAVAGDSAGGGLALALQVALREAGEPLPAATLLFSPWTDLAGTGRSLDFNDPHCVMFTAESLRLGATHYLAGADPRSPLVSPLYADLRGLSPLLIHVSGSEVLLDDSTRLAEKAREQGVDVHLEVWPGQPHIWQLWAPIVPEGRESLARACQFLHSRMPLPWKKWQHDLPFAVP